MYIDTKGIILKQVKTLDGGRMLHLFTPDLGKISVGVSHSERGKNKSALPLRPFTLGKYTLYKKRDSYYLNRAETLKSFYAIGENVNKYTVSIPQNAAICKNSRREIGRASCRERV